MQEVSNMRLLAPTKEKIKVTLASCGDKPLPEFLAQASTWQLDTLLECICELNIESNTLFRLNTVLLDHLKKEFALLGEKTILGYVECWSGALKSLQPGLRNYCLLIECVVHSADLLQGHRLREYLKVELPQLHAELLSLGHVDAASLICRCVFYVFIVEASYEHDVDFEHLKHCWDHILGNKLSWKSPTVLLCSFLLSVIMGFKGDVYLEALIDKEERINEMAENIDDAVFCQKVQFFSLLLDNIHIVIVASCSSSQTIALMRALINFYSERNSLHAVVASIYQSLHLPNANSSSLCRYFFYSILQLLSDLIGQTVQKTCVIAPSSKVTHSITNFGIWLSKISEMLLAEKDSHSGETRLQSTSRKSPEEIWAKVMSKYLERIASQNESYLIDCSNTRLLDALEVLNDKEFPLNAMPRIVGGALLGALLQLIMVFEGSQFSSFLQSIVALFRWNGDYCRGLLGHCGLKACKLFEKLARRGRSFNCVEQTRVILTHYLMASNCGSIFIEKCTGIMCISSLESADWRLCSMLLSSVSSTFCTVDSKLLFDDASLSSGFLKDHVIRLLKEQLDAFSSVDVEEANSDQLEAFALALKALRDLQLTERIMQIDLSIDKQIDYAVQICEAICNRRRKLSVVEQRCQNGDVIAAMVDFLTNQNRRACLLKWECLASLVSSRKDVVKGIMSDASVDELQCLLHNPLIGYSERQILKVFAMMAALQNDKKRRTLCEIFDRILHMMINVVTEDPRTVLTLTRLLLSQICGSVNERRLVSFALSFISASFPFLVETIVMTDEDAELLIEIDNTLLECLRWCSSGVIEDYCMIYAQLFVRSVQATQRYATSLSCNAELLVRNAHALSSVAHSFTTHRTHFSRMAPFMISECLSGASYTLLSIYHLLEVCDHYSIALLSTNLPPVQKRQFAHIYSQFHRMNALTV